VLLIAGITLLFALLNGRRSAKEAPDIMKPFSKPVNDFEGMGMTVLEGSLGKNGLEVEILNSTPFDIESGNEADFKLQKLVDGCWYCLERLAPLPDEQHGYGYMQGVPVTLRLDWSRAYAPLSPGEYRVVKRFFEYGGEGAKAYFFLAAEFEIE